MGRADRCGSRGGWYSDLDRPGGWSVLEASGRASASSARRRPEGRCAKHAIERSARNPERPAEFEDGEAAAAAGGAPLAGEEILASCCSPGVRFLQEGWKHEVVGIDALSDAIGEFQAGWPDGIDVRVEITTPIDSHHGFRRGGFAWVFGEEKGYGTDFVEVGADGKLATIVVFGDPGPPPTRTG